MVLRLVLVSIVAGLGCAPPSEAELAGWASAARTWLTAQLAEWDTRQPPDEEVFTPIIDTATPEATAAVTATADLGVEILDDELRALLGQEPRPVASSSDEPRTAADEPQAVEAADEELGAAVGKEPPAESPGEPRETADGTTRVAGDVAFDAVVEENVADFFQAEAAPPSATEPMSMELEDERAEAALLERAEDASPGIVPAPETEPFDILDDSDFSFGFGPSAEESRPAAAPVLPPVAEDLSDRGPAYGAGAHEQLGAAVRLTRDALLAWINLLQSPAIVTLPH